MQTLTTGVEDLEGWAFGKARTCERTLSPEEVIDASREGVDVLAIGGCLMPLWRRTGFARFASRWYIPLERTTVASGLEPGEHPGEFHRLDTAEGAALERVCEHWRRQAEAA